MGTLTKEQHIDRIEFVGAHRVMQVRYVDVIYEDGVPIAEKIVNRRVFDPDADMTLEVKELKDLSNAAWTQEIKDAFKQHKAKVKAVMDEDRVPKKEGTNE